MKKSFRNHSASELAMPGDEQVGLLSERSLQAITAAGLCFAVTIVIFAVSYIPAVAPDHVNFWRVALGTPVVLMGLTALMMRNRLSDHAFQVGLEIAMVPALAVNFVLIQITPATLAVFFNMIATMIFAGYFLRRGALLLTLLGGTAIAVSSLFTEPASLTPYLGSFLVVYIPTMWVIALLLQLQNAETLAALEDARSRALTDPLTGLGNLRALERAANERLDSRLRSANDPVSGVVLIDLDNFKSANTIHGHLGGDHALRVVGSQLLRFAPPDSVVARVGGDEFAVLVRASSRAGVIDAGSRLQAAVRSASSVMDLPGVEIDAAIGTAIFPDDGRTLDGLLTAADISMYEHKGRERPAKSGPAAAPAQVSARPEWIDRELDNAEAERPRRLSLDAITGGNNALIASRSIYARASAFAWAVWAVLLALSMVMPDAHPDSTLSWWMILLGGLAIAAGIFVANFEPQSKGHMVSDGLGLFVLAAVLAMTGGLESTMTPLLLLLVASQAWFWQTRLIAPRIAGPVVVALSPLFYDQLGTGQAYWIPIITVVAEVALIVILVLAMFYDRWLIAQLHDRADRLSLIDPLTGISNRRAFDAFVQDLIDEREGTGEFAIVMIDLDNFKQVNTSLGHLAGDSVLKAIADALESVGREDDCIARVGGDEFAAVLPDVGIEGARALAVRFVETVAGTPSARGTQVGASAGFALYPLHGESLDQLMFTADEALMSVKESGKGSARVARAIQAV